MRVIGIFRFFLFVAILIPAGSALAIGPTWGDYDGDGRSDLSVAIVYRTTASSAWLTRTGSGGYLFWTFAVPADAFVSGHYFGDNKFYPATVYVRNLQSPLEWRVKTPTGAEVQLSYGLPGDGIPNQQDVDCDGITDFVVTRNGRADYYPGFKLWYTTLSSAGGQVVESVFGLADDFAGLADMDGDRCAELVVLRRGTYTWYSKKLFDSAYSAVQWGLDGDIPLLPSDLNNDGLADYIVSRKTQVLQNAFVRYGAGNSEVFALGFNSSIPQVGNFLGVPFFTWHQRDTGWVALGDKSKPGNLGELHQFGVAQNFIIRADGSVVPPNSDGVFPPTGKGDENSPQCDVTTDFRDGANGALWKPVSEVTGRPVFLLGSEYWSGSKGVEKISIFGKEGTQVASGSRRTCCPNGNRAHFDVSKTASSLNASAPITVQLQLQNGTKECRIVETPTQRID